MLGYFLDKVIFPAPKPEYLTYSKLKAHEVRLNGLQGWRIENPQGMDVGVYFGGNAEDVSLTADLFSNFGFRVSYLFNYRGYGLSEGKPSQRALYEDGLMIHDHAGADGIPVIVGRSLGASVAAYVSAHRATKRVVLVTPFQSMTSLVREKAPLLHYFLRNRFPSDQYARTNQTPMLMVMAENDTLIPNRQTHALFRIWQGPKEYKVIRNAGHNDLHRRPEYVEAIRQFIKP
ncbi:MAG: alpha/beta hydrolase [Nibricoccus sp.]